MMAEPTPSSGDVRRGLADLFSGYRAEWLQGDLFALFNEPRYFPQLTARHPCFLVGGRGTGKTTALKCLSYQGQAALHALSPGDYPPDVAYVGMYYRVNTNRVAAFAGSEISDALWTKLFAHYVNLEFCELALKYVHWYGAKHPRSEALPGKTLAKVCASLTIPSADRLGDVLSNLELARLHFEAAVNNIADDSTLPQLSVQSVPIDLLMTEIRALPQFTGRTFFYLIDEYENLNASQQRVINTLIKHCGDLYSFKVGVRDLGLRERRTLRDDEQLVHPADYQLIEIAAELEPLFPEFAARVCELRFKRAIGSPEPVNVRALFPEISAEQEAVLLGADDVAARLKAEARGAGDDHLVEWLESVSALEAVTASIRAQAEAVTLSAKVDEIRQSAARWQRQYDNFKFAYLFGLRKGKRGIRKYYAGWRVYCALAGTNIRYLLELVDRALNLHLEREGNPLEPVDVAVQTKAAQSTGQKNLRELEGLSLSGARLTRLVLGLGRVFQVMAEDSVGHTPEVTQFHLRADSADQERRNGVEQLLVEGVMHLALLRYGGSKLQNETDIKEWDYALHPIFAAFFGFSHRRKRKIELADADIADLVERPVDGIRVILGRQNRTSEVALPEQLSLFENFYAIPHH